MKTEKNIPLSCEKHGLVKIVIQTFKFTFLNTNGKTKTSYTPVWSNIPQPHKQWSLLDQAEE
jgi:hypothetical protein